MTSLRCKRVVQRVRPPPRAIRLEEVAVVEAALRRAPADPGAARRVATIASLVVVDPCACGCGTVDFARTSVGEAPRPIADGIGRTAAGGRTGVLVFATSAEITRLEVYALGKSLAGSRLPEPSSIRPWGSR